MHTWKLKKKNRRLFDAIQGLALTVATRCHSAGRIWRELGRGRKVWADWAGQQRQHQPSQLKAGEWKQSGVMSSTIPPTAQLPTSVDNRPHDHPFLPVQLQKHAHLFLALLHRQPSSTSQRNNWIQVLFRLYHGLCVYHGVTLIGQDTKRKIELSNWTSNHRNSRCKCCVKDLMFSG